MQTDEEGQPRLVTVEQRSWRPRLVVGRELCVFEAVSCRGVAWHEIGSFAALQARRLAPFVRSGASAAVRNKTLMLWFWDQQEVESGLHAAGGDMQGRKAIAETLMLEPPAGDGELRLRCARGVDVMTLEGGAITRSRWEAVRNGPAVDGKVLSRPWALDRLGGSIDEAAVRHGTAPALQRGFTALSFAAAAGCGVYAAYWGGALLGAQERLASLQTDATLTVARIEQLAALRGTESRDREWISNYQRLGGSLQLEALLQALEAPLMASSVVIKELEVRNDETRLVLATTGPEMDLPGILQSLGRMPGVGNVALRENADARQATFSLQTAGYRRIVTPVSSRLQ